jgi:hypothetical protein
MIIVEAIVARSLRELCGRIVWCCEVELSQTDKLRLGVLIASRRLAINDIRGNGLRVG